MENPKTCNPCCKHHYEHRRGSFKCLEVKNACIVNANIKNETVENSNINNLTTTNAVIQNETVENSNINNLIAENATIKNINVLPKVDLINRQNLTITPEATLELINNSIPDDFEGDDPTIYLEMPNCPIGTTKTFLLTSIGTPDTSADVQVDGNGISMTMKPVHPNAFQSGTFIFGGDDNGWINIAASTPVPQIPSYFSPINSETLKFRKNKRLGLKQSQIEKTAIQVGYSLDVSSDGTLTAVGAPFAGEGGNIGQVQIFSISGKTTMPELKATLVPNPGSNIGSSLFGSSVSFAINGKIIAIGGPGDDDKTGATWLFTRNDDNSWTQNVKLVGSSIIPTKGSQQGYSVALSGFTADGDAKVLAVGSPTFGFGNSNVGAVWIYMKDQSGTWIPKGFVPESKTVTPIPGTLFGYSVSLNQTASQLAVGGPGLSGGIGAVWIYTLVNQSNYRIDGTVRFSNLATDQLVSSRILVVKFEPEGGIGNVSRVIKKRQEPLPLVSFPLDTVSNKTGNFGNVCFDGNNNLQVVYQVPCVPGQNTLFSPYIVTHSSNTPYPQTIEMNKVVFVTTVNVSASYNIPAQPRRLINASPKIAANKTTNDLFIVYTNSSNIDSSIGSETMSINLAKSIDGGITWNQVTAPRPLALKSAFFSNIAIDQTTGKIAVAWLDCANSPGNDTYEANVRISSDNGVTWGVAINLCANIGHSNSALSQSGLEAGDYIGLDFDKNKLAVVWADNSEGITPPNPNPLQDFSHVIGIAVMKVSGNGIIGSPIVRNASGNDLNRHVSPSVAINRTNSNIIAVSATKDIEDGDALYYATSIDGGNTWKGSPIANVTVGDQKRACCNSGTVSDNSGKLYLSYESFDQVSPTVIGSSDFGVTPASFQLVANLETDPARTILNPFISYTSFNGKQYLALIWNDATQGYTMQVAEYLPGSLAKQSDWGKPLVCPAPLNKVEIVPSEGKERKSLSPTNWNPIFGYGGASVSIQSNTLAIGCPNDVVWRNGDLDLVEGSSGETAAFIGPTPFCIGSIFVFTGNEKNWSQLGTKLVGTGYATSTFTELSPGTAAQGGGQSYAYQGSPRQGYAVALSKNGQTLVAGGPDDGVGNTTGTGAYWKFTRNSNNLFDTSGALRNGRLTDNGKQGSAVGINGDGTVAAAGAPLTNTSQGDWWIF